ncbi:MFS transporter [Paenarthrobacter sp. YJN-5]|uniref:MFS transporter n=1 Tax=Paenarthrobacter sp. YJN-5 TaxID=2735316 RepID=UPI001878CAE8|nr:MFS transporter [Paenarthrobacter sp. YJN-5]QOT19828.1 MFS transporter [Paenarthrobacter sp. YJN-5]
MPRETTVEDTEVRSSPGDQPRSRTLAYVCVICGLAWVMSVYDFTLFGTLLPAIAEDFGWSAAEATMFNTVCQIGIFFVSLVPGYLIDRVGRKKSLIIMMVGGALVAGFTGAATGVLSLLVIRALSGLSLAEEVVNAVYLSEMLEKVKRRGLIYSLVQSGWPIGALLGAGICALTLPLVGWRWSFVIAGVATLLIVPFALKLPVSRRDEKTAKVAAALKATPREKKSLAQEFRILFSPSLRKHTLAMCGAWLFNWFGNQVFTVLGTTVLLEAKGIPLERGLIILVVSNVVAFIGYLCHGWLGDRVGRRNTIVRSWMIAAALSVVLMLGPSNELFVFVIYSLFLFFQLGPYAALLFYMGESFPEEARGSGANLAHALAPIGSIFGSGILAVLLGMGVSMSWSAIFAGSIFLAISAFCMRFGVDDRKLRDRSTTQPVAAKH